MSEVNRKDLKWTNNILYQKGKELLSVVPDSRHPSQWRIKWPNGDFSTDFYNYSRVKDNAEKYIMEI
jgi:hypothetical protein